MSHRKVQKLRLQKLYAPVTFLRPGVSQQYHQRTRLYYHQQQADCLHIGLDALTQPFHEAAHVTYWLHVKWVISRVHTKNGTEL